MARDSALQQRIDQLNSRLAGLRQQRIEAGSWSTPKERAYLASQIASAERRLAMLLEDERRPTFAKPAEFGRADDYAAWRKEQGI